MATENRKKLGLIAGYGEMPVEIIKAATSEGYEIVCVALKGMAFDNLQELTPHVEYVDMGEIQKAMMFLKAHNISQLFFAGKVEKTRLFSGQVALDPQAMGFLQNLQMKNDDSILSGLVRLFEQVGLEVLDSTTFLKTLLPAKGTLTSMEVSSNIMDDVEFGYRIAKEIAGLDIGQTVVVKDKVVLAVEAIEGTDCAILRGGELGKSDSVVVKVAKPRQDFRFDVPTIGMKTIEHCIKAGVTAIAFDSGATILLNREQVIGEAEKHSIHLISL
jgi:DUF1009 family protein